MERDGTSHPASRVGPWRNWPACICPSLRFTWRVTRCRLSLLAGRASHISTSLLRNAADVSESISLLYFVPSLESLLVSFAAFFFKVIMKNSVILQQQPDSSDTSLTWYHSSDETSRAHPLVTRCDSGGEFWDSEQSWMWKWSTPGLPRWHHLLLKLLHKQKKLDPDDKDPPSELQRWVGSHTHWHPHS